MILFKIMFYSFKGGSQNRTDGKIKSFAEIRLTTWLYRHKGVSTLAIGEILTIALKISVDIR